MAYSIEQDEQMMAMFGKISAEPVVESSNYNEVRSPRPLVESTRSFDGLKVNLEAWGGTEAAPKNNKTAKTGNAKQVTKNDTVNATKTKGQITKVVSDNASHEAKNEPAVKGGSFETAAKSAASSQRSGADSKKKFEENCRYQKKCKMFKEFVTSLGVDAESSAAAAKIIRKFDELNKKAKMESLVAKKPRLESLMGITLGGAIISSFKEKVGREPTEEEMNKAWFATLPEDIKPSYDANGGLDNYSELVDAMVDSVIKEEGLETKDCADGKCGAESEQA